MEIIKNFQKVTLTPEGSTTIHEYPILDGFIGGAVAEIEGRYPANGFVMNTKIKEVAYVLSGTGALETKEGRTDIAADDFVFIDHREAFAWQQVGFVHFHHPCV